MTKRFLALALVLMTVSALQSKELPKPEFTLQDYGTEELIDYEKYGQFENIGQTGYRYIIKDRGGLNQACGTGVYPNVQSVFKEPKFQEYRKSGALNGKHWDFSGRNRELNFYKWNIAAEDPATKAFNAALNLERGGLLVHALKAYHALIVHFPRAVAYTYWKTPWYPAMSAADKIQNILRTYPDINVQWIEGEVLIENSFDNEIANDVVICKPGKLVKKRNKKIKPDYEKSVKKIIGKGRVQLVQYKNDHWQLLVEGQPYLVRGLAYTPTPVGQTPEKQTMTDWMQSDINQNGIIDAPFESWVDKNWNNIQDTDEQAVGDFQLLKEMGVNTLRVYHHQDHPKAKEILHRAYKEYGLMTMMGDFVGMYARDSGASWTEGTDYRNYKHRQVMFESVKKMVLDYKDEPYILMWVLGNENVFGVANNAGLYPKEYFKFINELAEWIHSVDPNRPVAVCNGDLLFIDSFAKYAPAVDVFGANAYRGEHGFGDSFWRGVKLACDKPMLVTEYGCSSYFKDESQEYAQEWQARYHEGNWNDILYNSYGYGYGNAIGGVVFEWIDEWWKTMHFGDPYKHKIEHAWGGPFPDGNMYEEWLGLTSQGDGQHSPFMRQLRQTYFLYKDKLWKK